MGKFEMFKRGLLRFIVFVILLFILFGFIMVTIEYIKINTIFIYITSGISLLVGIALYWVFGARNISEGIARIDNPEILAYFQILLDRKLKLEGWDLKEIKKIAK